MPPSTRALIATQVRAGRIAAVVMLHTFACLDEQGVPLDLAVERATIAAARAELPDHSGQASSKAKRPASEPRRMEVR